jgi:DNA topoisomerase-1
MRDANKFARMVDFGEALPCIRQRVADDSAQSSLSRTNVLAILFWLLNETGIHVGNEEYVRENGHFRLTTLRTEHVEIGGSTLRIEYCGKRGKWQALEVHDRRLARLVLRCQDLPDHELFRYVGNDSERQAVDSADVNAYLREISGQDVTAKDFRTWAGTVTTARRIRNSSNAGSTGSTSRGFRLQRSRASVHISQFGLTCREDFG